ncbi:transposase [Massilia sp.]|uniref:transposase n=1 Tax=Massilia sp. TaxID=1882437 RepID=UPI00391BE6D0
MDGAAERTNFLALSTFTMDERRTAELLHGRTPVTTDGNDHARTAFQEVVCQAPSLNLPQRLQTLAALHPAAGLDQVIALIGQIGGAMRRCPSCACERYYRHGQANGLQRYRCRACGRTYNDLSGTPLARLRLRGKWLDYLGTLIDSTSVRAAAKEVGVHRNTAFRWRHRFLKGPEQDQPQRLGGIAEADEILPNYLGWRRALDGGRITMAEQLLRIAIGVIHSER